MEIHPSQRHHIPRLKTQDFGEQEPALKPVLTSWWETHRAIHKASPQPHHLANHQVLQHMMQEATNAYAKVAGWSNQSDVKRPRVLPGHYKLRRELDALFTFRRAVQRTLDRCEQVDVARIHDQ